VVNMPRRVVGMQNMFFHIGRADMEHPRLVMVGLHNGVIVMLVHRFLLASSGLASPRSRH
jgi:hypothetical protein